MKLGMDIYTVRSQGWDAFQLLDYSRQIGLDLVHFSDLSPFRSLEDDYLDRVKARADELGLAIEVGMLSICESSVVFDRSAGSAVDQVAQMLHVADKLGSPILRCVQGSSADRQTELPWEAHIENTIATCRAVRSQCLDLGIKLALENHAGDFHGSELAALIQTAGPEYVGACIDSGNPLWAGESPFVTLEHLAPYIVTSHIRDTAVWQHKTGASVQWVAMGDGNIGIKAWSQRFIELCPHVPFSLEIITAAPPRVLDYLEDDSNYWRMYPETPAREFARFEKLVRYGEPYIRASLTVAGRDLPAEYQAALAVQQRIDLERSLAWCKQELGVGES
jgi:3-oxoisoapionate decarboxylase